MRYEWNCRSHLSAVVALAVLLVGSAVGGLWVSRNRETSSRAVAWFAAFGSIVERLRRLAE